MKILDILNQISKESSRNAKTEILFSHKDNDTLKTVLYKGMSKRVKFWVKQIPSPNRTRPPVREFKDIEWALTELNLLESRTVTGNAAQLLIALILGNISPDDAEVITRIIKKDLKLGLGAVGVNPILDKKIEITPYM